MATITEDYVSFETAKLLKENGLDCETDMYYSTDGELRCWNPNGLKSLIDNKGNETWWWKCVAPTLQMAMKWLREVHKLHIWIGCNNKRYLPWYYEIHNIKTGMVAKIGGINCGSYETACEEAIKYCLKNLI